MRLSLVLAGLALAAGTAVAEDRPRPRPVIADPPPSTPDPSAVSAGDANLESTARRQGFNFTFAGGAGLTVGFGVDDAVGNGGAASFRLGRVASPRTQITLELAGVVLLHGVDQMAMQGEARNEDTNVLVGGQFYVNRSLWIRVATGFGVYKARQVPVGKNADGTTLFGDVELRGPSGLFGAGIDLVRWRRVSLGLEMMAIGMINRDGLLSSNALMFDVTIE